MSFWKYLWIGFSTNEQYIALLGIPFTWAFVRLYWHARPSNAGMPLTWAVCLLSALLLAGTKENMVILAAALALLLAISIYQDRRVDYRLVAGTVTIALIGAIIGIILLSLRTSGGVDQYGQSVLPIDRAMKLAGGLRHYPFPILFAFSALTYVLRNFLRKKLQPAGTLKAVDILAQFQVWLVILCISQLVFYDGWPNGNRYEFPAQLFVFASCLIPVFMGGLLVKAIHPNRWISYQTAIFVLAAGAAALRGYGDFRREAATYVERSHAYTSVILGVEAMAKAQPGTQILIESSSPYDLEPIFAVNRFLLSLGVTNPMFVRVHSFEAATYPRNEFFQKLADTIGLISAHGTITVDTGTGILPSPFLVRYKPLTEFKPSAPCVSIRLNGAPSDGCPSAGNIAY